MLDNGDPLFLVTTLVIQFRRQAAEMAEMAYPDKIDCLSFSMARCPRYDVFAAPMLSGGSGVDRSVPWRFRVRCRLR